MAKDLEKTQLKIGTEQFLETYVGLLIMMTDIEAMNNGEGRFW